MNINNIWEMAGESGFRGGDYIDVEKFAALVEAAARADEREACAKMCDDNYFAFVAADAIRARGNT